MKVSVPGVYAMRILKWIPANPLLGVQKIKRRGRQ